VTAMDRHEGPIEVLKAMILEEPKKWKYGLRQTNALPVIFRRKQDALAELAARREEIEAAGWKTTGSQARGIVIYWDPDDEEETKGSIILDSASDRRG
jgi:hypothetical protein